MDTEQPDIKEIFYAAIETKSKKQRDAYLDEVCRGDRKLRAEVEVLLKAHDQAGSFLEEPAVGAKVTLDESPLTEGPGTKIGRYKLLQLIGEGGFGVVYMAEQERPIRRRVALKIIKLGMDTKQVIARFEAERQALAMMDHPNIARVFDAGATETGRPYFVMELVKGTPVTDYCDKNNLETRQRLELFIDVCRAIQHAHQKGIIHRDIKPSNVMITLHDGKPVPKIIDFGIAKATQNRLTEKTLFTEFRQFIGTPEYMSPEQAEMSELDVDTRSDIYSLGVLLYEQLTGTTPFAREQLLGVSYDQMRKVISETDPQKPSTRLSTLGDVLADVAKHRNVQPGELRRIVRGDLDWIVMKALEKDRTRRYETANEFALDIGRHLGHEPVLASPPSGIYRARKFARRHRTGVAVGLSLGASLIIGLSLAVTGFVQASQEQVRTKAALKQSGMNFEMARQAVDEMTLVAQEQLVNIPKAEKVRQELLESAQNLYLKFLEAKSDDPALRHETGRAYQHLGTIQNTLGQYEKAAASFRQAIHFFELLAQDYPDVPDHQMMIAVSNNSLGVALEKLGRYNEVLDAYQRASELLQALVNDFPDHEQYREALAETFNNQGLILNSVGQADQAWESFENALEIREELVGWFPDNPKYRHDLAGSYHNRGIVLENEIDVAHIDPLEWLPEVERAYRQAMQIQQSLVDEFPEVHEYQSRLTAIQLSLSNFLWRIVRPDEAEEVLRDGIPLAQKLADDFPGIPEYQIALVEMRHKLNTFLDEITYPGAPFASDDPAMDSVLKAKECYEKLVCDSPGVHAYHYALAKTFAYLAFWSDPEYPEMLGESVRHMQTAVRLNPMNTLYRWDLVESSARMFRNLRDFGRSTERAEQIFEQNITLFEQLRQEVPACIYELARTFIDLANLLEYTGSHDEAQSAYQRAEDVRLELVAQFPELPFEWRLGNVGRSADYKIRINSAGDYRLYIRAAAYDWASDSVNARIEELADGPGGKIADGYYVDFQERSDCKFGAWTTPTEFEVIPVHLAVDTWPISAPGDYTIRLYGGEDGVAVDAFAFQLADLPPPQGDGPPESAITEDGIFLESDGQVVAEAEHSTKRIPYHQKWVIIPEEDANASSSFCLFDNFKGEGYLQQLPDFRGTRTDIEQLTRTLENHPEDVSAIMQRGNVYWHLKQYDNALVDYCEAIRLDPNHPEIRWAMSNLGELYLRRGRYVEAEQVLRQAEKVFEKLATDFPDVRSHRDYLAYSRIQLCEVFTRTGRPADAITACRQAIDVWESLADDLPDGSAYKNAAADNHFRLGNLLREAGRPEEAAASYRQAITLKENLAEEFPDRIDYQTSLAIDLAEMGKIQSESGQLEEAERTIRRGILLYEKVQDAFPDMRREQWTQVRARIILGDLLMKTGRGQEAESQYALAGEFQQKLLADFSDDDPHYRWDLAWNHVLLGNMLEQTGRLSEAIKTYEEVIELKEKTAEQLPDVPDYRISIATDLTTLGNMLGKAGRPEEARQAYQNGLLACTKAIELDPNNSDLWYTRANSCASVRQYRQAINDYSRAIELGHFNAYIFYLRALAYLGTGDTQGYRKECATMLEQFKGTDNMETAHWVAWTCALGADSVQDWSEPLRLVEMAATENSEALYQHCLGKVLYRAGRLNDAVEQLSALTAGWEKSGEFPAHTSPAYTWFFLAMAHHQLGNIDQSQRYFELAVKRAEEEITVGTWWNRELTLQLLQAEAAEMLGIPEETVQKAKEAADEKKM